ncbi:hypothetical protein ACMFMF_006527 [Clarireedia jacksonii]
MPNLLHTIFQQRRKLLENYPDIVQFLPDDEMSANNEDNTNSRKIDLNFSEAGGIPDIAYNKPQKSIVGAEWDFTDRPVTIYTQIMEGKKARVKELSLAYNMFSRLADVYRRRQTCFDREMHESTRALNGLRSLADNGRRKRSGLQEVKRLVNKVESTKPRVLAVKYRYQRVVAGLEYLERSCNILWTDYWALHFPCEL